MSVDFYVCCPSRRDRFELGSGAWGWHYPDDPSLRVSDDPSIYRLLGDPGSDLGTDIPKPLHRDDRDAFAAYVLRVWLLGHVEAGHEDYILDVGGRLYDYCAERGWDVRLVCDIDDDEGLDYAKVASRYEE